MLTCKICGHEAMDLGKHIRLEHKMALSRYRKELGDIVDPSVLEKRKATCLAKYGVEHYTNRPAAALSNMTFEGGHFFRDPEVRDKIRKTKNKRYGNPTYTNRRKARETCLKKYGVEHTCVVPEVVEKRLETLKKRYGKVFNIKEPHNKKSIPQNLREEYLSGILLEDIASNYGVSLSVVSRWVKELGLKRPPLKTSHIVMPLSEIVSLYFDRCLEKGRCLSFYEFGVIAGAKYLIRLKRLFNRGKSYHHLKQDLFDCALDTEKQKSFLKQLLFNSSV